MPQNWFKINGNSSLCNNIVYILTTNIECNKDIIRVYQTVLFTKGIQNEVKQIRTLCFMYKQDKNIS